MEKDDKHVGVKVGKGLKPSIYFIFTNLALWAELVQ